MKRCGSGLGILPMNTVALMGGGLSILPMENNALMGGTPKPP
jgi:hypothetical protein